MIHKSPVRALVIAFGILVPLLALGQLAPQLQKGLNWLTSRVQQALVQGEDSSMALPLQVRSETMQTLRSLAVLPAPLADAVFAYEGMDADTETLARRVVAGSLGSRDVQPLLAVLAVRQNIDGGFGGGPGYSSHVLDTAWAVLALAQAGQGAGDSARRARDWLASRVVAEGPTAGALLDAEGSRGASPPLRLYATALASLALQTGTTDVSVQAAQRLTTWLSAQQGGDGGWAGDTLVSAWVLLAVSPVSSDSGLKSAASTFLQSRQAADGSWSGDPYLTAVALRALTVKANPTGGGAGQAAITGVVVDAGSGLPVQGANVAASPAASTGGAPASTISDEQGRFLLGGLAAGSYTVGISRSGYQNLTASTGLAGSQTADLGRLRLQASASTGIVRGQKPVTI